MQKGNEEASDHFHNGVRSGILSIGEHLLYQSHNLAGNRSLRVRNFVLVDHQRKTRDNRNQNGTDHLFDWCDAGRIDRSNDGKADKTLIVR